MTFSDEQDLTTARLRAALNAQAELVQPGEDGLRAIRERVAEGGGPWWRSPAAVAVAAALVLVAAIGGMTALLLLPTGPQSPEVVAGPGSDGPASTPADSPSDPGATVGTTTPSPSETPVGVEGDVYVYYVASDGKAGGRLYREQRPNPGMDPVLAAISTMLAEPALDRDYDIESWPAGTEVLAYTAEGETATIEMSVPEGADWEDYAMQQLVYTVTANDPVVNEIQLIVNGRAMGSPFGRAPMVDVQGLIWVLEPRHDSEVTSPVQIVGYGTAFEGTVSWDVTNVETGEVVSGFTSAGANGEFADFYDEVELEPGQYKIRAYESSAEDGRPLHVDDKTFTVVD